MKRRAAKLSPAMLSSSCGAISAALARTDDLDLVALAERQASPLAAWHYRAVHRDGDETLPRIDAARGEQRRQRCRLDLLDFAVDAHGSVLLCRKPIDAERPDRIVERAGQHEAGDRIGGCRGQQDAVAIMSGGEHQPVDGAGSEQ